MQPFLHQVGLSFKDIDAVLVTHCHTDHTYGLKFLCQAQSLPLYSTPGVLKQLHRICRFKAPPPLIPLNGDKEKIGSLQITYFPLSHDVETIGFRIDSNDGERLGMLTDTGYLPEHCLTTLTELDYLYIESNHERSKYQSSRKPYRVIRRNLGPTGHLSNQQCGQALQDLALKDCRLVVLGHLSEEDNEPALALASARHHLADGIPLRSAPARTPGVWSDNLSGGLNSHR